jgi:predicted amidohydrolase
VCPLESIAAVIVAGIQHDIVWEDPRANFEHLAPMIADAAARGAGLVVATEMFSTGFSMHTERTSEPPDGASLQFLLEQARAHNVVICASVPERAGDDPRPFNQLVVAMPDGTTHRYAKRHPFSYGREHEHFASGDEFLTVTIDGVRCAFFVCYDLRFADDFWSLAPATDCYVIPANWPASRRDHWLTLLRARAIENQAYVVGVNRVGKGGKLDYSGDSIIVDPFGEICAQAGDKETIITANVDPARVAQVRAEYPFLQDRR